MMAFEIPYEECHERGFLEPEKPEEEEQTETGVDDPNKENELADTKEGESQQSQVEQSRKIPPEEDKGKRTIKQAQPVPRSSAGSQRGKRKSGTKKQAQPVPRSSAGSQRRKKKSARKNGGLKKANR